MSFKKTIPILSLCAYLAVSATSCFTDQKQPVANQGSLEELEKIITEEQIPEIIEAYTNDYAIATWNIQVFGRSKVSDENTDVFNIIVSQIQNYDFVAIQEIRDASGTAILKLMQELPEYSYIIGERQGRSNSKEQYAFIFNDSFEPIGNYNYVDSNDVFEREPYIGYFSVGDENIVFINIHTAPDDAYNEIVALQDVYQDALTHFNDEDIIIMGDFNQDGTYADENLSLEGLKYLIPGEEDTMVRESSDNAYDRMVISPSLEDNFEYYQVEKLTDYDIDFQLRVSDHYMIGSFWKF